MTSANLHDTLYSIVEEICWDPDYLYRLFTEHFGGFMAAVYSAGSTAGRGEYRLDGIKSGLEARITWKVQHRIDFKGLNQLLLDVVLLREPHEVPEKTESLLFDLASGRRLPLT